MILLPGAACVAGPQYPTWVLEALRGPSSLPMEQTMATTLNGSGYCPGCTQDLEILKDQLEEAEKRCKRLQCELDDAFKTTAYRNLLDRVSTVEKLATNLLEVLQPFSSADPIRDVQPVHLVRAREVYDRVSVALADLAAAAKARAERKLGFKPWKPKLPDRQPDEDGHYRVNCPICGTRSICTHCDELRMALLNLLARIHRDGGHHTEKVGLEQAVIDADAEVVRLLSAADALKKRVIKLNQR